MIGDKHYANEENMNLLGPFKNAEECAYHVYTNFPDATGAMFHDTSGQQNCGYRTDLYDMSLEGKHTAYYSCLFRGMLLLNIQLRKFKTINEINLLAL